MKFPGKYSVFPLLIILQFLLSGCVNEGAQFVSDVITNYTTENSVTVSVSETPTATSIPPDTPQPKPSLTPTQTPTLTPTPAPTLSPTSIPSPTHELCNERGQVLAGSYPSQLAGPQRSYRIYLPPCYEEADRVYPTLYLLHGSASTDSQWDDLGVDEAADELILAGDIPPLIIVMPDGGYIANNSSGGPYSFEGVILAELVPNIEATYCSWSTPGARAIGGLSRGGYWALEIAIRNSQEFASVGAHSAALVDTHAGPELNPQYTALSHNLGDLRIYMDIGQEDWFIPNIRKLHQDMEAAGIEHTWILNDGSHVDSYWTDHVRDYLLWYSLAWPAEADAYPACVTPQS